MKYNIKYLGGMSNTLNDDTIRNIILKIENINKEINEIKDSLLKYVESKPKDSSLQEYGLQEPGLKISEDVPLKYNLLKDEGELYFKTERSYMDDTIADLFFRRLPKDVAGLGIYFNRIAIDIQENSFEKDSFEIRALYYSSGVIPGEVKTKLINIYTNVIDYKNKIEQESLDKEKNQDVKDFYSEKIKKNNDRLQNNINRINNNTKQIWFPLGRFDGKSYTEDDKFIYKIMRFDAFNLPRGGGNHMICFFIGYLRNKHPGQTIEIVLQAPDTVTWPAYINMGFEYLGDKVEKYKSTHILNIDKALEICENKSYTDFVYYEQIK